MEKLPTVCELLEFLTCKLGTIVSNQGVWYAMSAELLFQKFNHSTGCVLLQHLYLDENRIEVHDDYVIFSMKLELICSNSAPRAVWNLMTLHWFLWILGLQFTADGTL